MTIEVSEAPCPDCEAPLQVIYATELAQVLTGVACTACGFCATEEGRHSVALADAEEYVLHRARPFTDADVRESLSDPRAEFGARADEHREAEEVWLLVDPADGSLVDVRADRP